MDQPQHTQQAPSCEECQHHRSRPAQSEAEPALCALEQEGDSASSRTVGRATEQPRACGWCGRKGACSQPEHGIHFSRTLGQPADGEPGIYLWKIPDGLWPSSPHPRHGCVCLLWPRVGIQRSLWQLEVEVGHMWAIVDLQAWNTSMTVAPS